jgi:hypothetical protein
MNKSLVHIFRFFLFVLLQIFVLNQIELGWGVLPMIYPLVIFLLPAELDIILLMIISAAMGVLIDFLSNTFGLHTSALLLFAYIKPWVFKKFAPREEYVSIRETNIFTMGMNWFVYTFGTLIVLHHLWFFLFEVADLSDLLYVLQKTILSVVVSFMLCIGLQVVFIKKPKER